MNSLTTRYRRSQLIALPVPGGAGPVQYRYAVRVSGHCVPVSYQLAQQMVGEFNHQAEAFACRNSTDDTATGGELKSSSLVTTAKKDRLSSGAPGNGYAFLAEVRQNSWSLGTAGVVTASFTLRIKGKPVPIVPAPAAG